jgi:hypothetical protein
MTAAIFSGLWPWPGRQGHRPRSRGSTDGSKTYMLSGKQSRVKRKREIMAHFSWLGLGWPARAGPWAASWFLEVTRLGGGPPGGAPRGRRGGGGPAQGHNQLGRSRKDFFFFFCFGTELKNTISVCMELTPLVGREHRALHKPTKATRIHHPRRGLRKKTYRSRPRTLQHRQERPPGREAQLTGALTFTTDVASVPTFPV